MRIVHSSATCGSSKLAPTMNRRESTELKLLAVIVIYILTEALTSASSADAFSNDEIRDMEKFAGDVMGCVGIPGLSIGVVRGDATFSTGKFFVTSALCKAVP